MNDLIILNNNTLTMSSLDLLTMINLSRMENGQNPHEPRKFLWKVEDEIDGLCGKKFRLNNNQTESAYYDLTIDQCMLVGMRESKGVRRNVLEKLKELQKPQVPQVPQSYAAALLEAGRLALINEQQAKELEQAKPKVEFVEKYVESTSGSKTFRQVCKLLEANEREFREFLVSAKVLSA